MQEHHLRTLPFCHARAEEARADRPAAWLRGAAAAGTPLPLALARDLGLLLVRPLSDIELAKPPHLPFDQETGPYLAFLDRFARHPLVRELTRWKPPPSDAVLAIILARLIRGLALPDIYRIPSGPAGAVFLRSLAVALEGADPGRIWESAPPEGRPDWLEMLPTEALARIEANLAGLDREELRFLVRYGPPLEGAPDPRDILDLIALDHLPDAARLALSQTLKLLPRVGSAQTVGGVQTYPEGGYEGLARKGSLDSLLLTELAYPDDIFLHRVLNHEALYYGRERPRERRREMAYIVTQLGWGMGGDGDVLARALTLALAQAMRGRGYRVVYSLAGPALTEPADLETPGDVARLLYRREPGRVDEEKALLGVLNRLRAWREVYPGRQALWVLSDYFDMDGSDDHAALYHDLRAEAGQQAWFVHVGRQEDAGDPPPAARRFETWQRVATATMWDR